MNVDQGTRFGTWTDETSRLLYRDAMPALLNGVDTSGSVLDLGGGNGLLRQFIPHALTVDSDASKNPDILADITEFYCECDLAVLRYVLHYMSDKKLVKLFADLRDSDAKRVLVIQFVNDDLEAKLANSVNELKWFRSELDLRVLISACGWVVTKRKRLEYRVEAEFYRNRLNHPNPTAHDEAVVSLLLERRA